MKRSTFLTLLFIFFFAKYGSTQLIKQIGERTKEKVKQRTEQKIETTIDKTLDKAESKIDSIGTKKKPKKTRKGNNAEGTNMEDNSDSQISTSTNNDKTIAKNTNTNVALIKVDRAFDFIPGEKIIFVDNFSNENTGNFPKKWASNGNGSIVKINNEPINHLQINKEVVFYPEMVKNLPEEFTVEFDLMCNEDFNYYSYHFAVGMTNAKELKQQWNYFGRFGHGGETNSRVEVLWHPNDEGEKKGLTEFVATHKTKEQIRSVALQNLLSVKAQNTKVHISIWRQKQRVRVYMNDKKVWDIPNALENGVPINTIYFRSNGTDNEVDTYYLSNIKIATGNVNSQISIKQKGSYSTSNILFDVNSDKIKPESFGVLKEMAAMMEAEPLIKVKIIGHTDSDGDANSNLLLSQKRAAAVKNALVQLFNIDATRMETDGKGSSEPLTQNTSPENKAQNRRVVLIKL